jgi:hypothetical protein
MLEDSISLAFDKKAPVSLFGENLTSVAGHSALMVDQILRQG